MLRTYCSARRSSCVPIRFLLQGIFFSYHPSQVFLGNFLTEIKEQIKTNKTAKSETGTSSPNPLLNPKEAFLWGYLGLDKRMKNNSNVRSNWHSSLSHSLQNKSFSKSMPQNFQNTHQFQSSFISVNILHIPGLVSWAMKDLLSATLVSSSRLQSILVKTARMYFKKKMKSRFSLLLQTLQLLSNALRTKVNLLSTASKVLYGLVSLQQSQPQLLAKPQLIHNLPSIFALTLSHG